LVAVDDRTRAIIPAIAQPIRVEVAAKLITEPVARRALSMMGGRIFTTISLAKSLSLGTARV
jgi:hypothetical protein